MVEKNVQDVYEFLKESPPGRKESIIERLMEQLVTPN